MLSAIPRPRPNISPYAPRLVRTKIDPEKIGLLIGPGGKTIRGIQEETGVDDRRRGRRHGHDRRRATKQRSSGAWLASKR